MGSLALTRMLYYQIIALALFVLHAAQAAIPCVSFNEGAAAAAREGILDVFTCAADEISLNRCADPMPVKEGQSIRPKQVTWSDVVIMVDAGSFSDTEALRWWVQMVTEPLTMVLIDAPCGGDLRGLHTQHTDMEHSSECDRSVVHLKKMLLMTRKQLQIAIVQPPVTALSDDPAYMGSQRTYRLLYGLLIASQLMSTKKFVFKLDADTILFPRRFFDFLSTLNTIVPVPLEPVYFGTLRKGGVETGAASRVDTAVDGPETNGSVPLEATPAAQGDDGSNMNCGYSSTARSTVCYADDASGFGLNTVALQVIEPVLRSALHLPPMPQRFENGIAVAPVEVQFPVNSVGELIASALKAFSTARNTTGVSNTGRSVIHCGSFGASDLIAEDTGLHQTISFHYVETEWLKLNRHHLITHYDRKYAGTMEKIQDLNTQMHILSELNPLHSDFEPAAGDEYGLKVLVVSSDNRHLSADMNSKQYYGAAAILQYHYCRRHGYDYLRVFLDGSSMLIELRERFPNYIRKLELSPQMNDLRAGALVFHPAYKYLRRPSWGKLIALWHVMNEVGHRYDYIWFMDSDAAPNTFDAAVSLGEKMKMWSERPPESVVIRGNPNISSAQFVFLSNFPWRSDLPCAGNFMIRSSNRTLQAILDWWDYDLPQKNFADFLEQDALWYMLEAPKTYRFPLNWKSVSLVNEHQFPSEYNGVPNLWIAHIINYDRNRLQYLNNL